MVGVILDDTNGVNNRIRLPIRGVRDDVEGFCRECGITVGNFLNAIFAYTYSRFTGSGKVYYNFTEHGRHETYLEDALGMYIRTIPIIVDCENKSIKEYLSDVSDLILALVEQPLLALNSSAGYWGLIILMCWQQIGYMMIIYIAGLQNISEDVIEAAKVDGANAIQTLFRVKIPMVMSSITVCVFLTLTNSFKLFDQNLALTGGEPNHMTDMMALNIYNTFYARAGMQWKGYGQAKAVIFCILVVTISLMQLNATRKKEVQS